MKKHDFSMACRFVLLCTTIAWVPACGESTHHALELLFPDRESKERTAGIALWVLGSTGQISTCGRLFEGSATPGEMTVHDQLELDYPPPGENLQLESPAEEVIFFAECRDDEGTPILRGCEVVTVLAGRDLTVGITLEWMCRADPRGEQPDNGRDDDCDGLTDECLSNQACDDGNPCTADQCDESTGTCSYSWLADGMGCNDGDPCTLDDACTQGACQGTALDCSAWDSPCKDGVCNPATGQCESATREDGVTCDDGLYCTVDDTCQGGFCIGTDRDCDDQDECTRDVCLEATDTCEHTLVPKPGAEGPYGDPTCENGIDDDCDALTDADDNNCRPCTETAECDDGNACTEDDCVGGVCENTPASDGTPCQDDKYCTDPDACSGGVCTGPTRDCSHLDEDCLVGVCAENLDTCQTAPVADGTACDDGDGCTMDDACSGGSCTGVDLDADGDSFVSDACGGSDCDDSDPQVNPFAREGPAWDPTCDDGVDNDCDGDTDTDDPNCTDNPDICTTEGWCWEHPFPTSHDLFAVWGAAPDDLWAVGQWGTILHWNGSTWTMVASNTTAILWGVWGTATDDIWMVGDNGTALHWDGLALTPSATGSSQLFRDVWTSGPNDVWVASEPSPHAVFHWTGSGGWTQPSVDPFNADLHGIWGTGPADIWAVGEDGVVVHGSGGSFSSVPAAGTTENLFDVWGTASDDVYACGGAGTLLRWNGSAWSSVSSSTMIDLYGLSGTPDGQVWAVGIDGIAVHRDGAGGSFARKESNTQADLLGLHGVADGVVWAVGRQGTILRWNASEDAFERIGGSDFQDFFYGFNGIWGSTVDDIWVVGPDGTVMRRQGGGWSPVPVPTVAHLYGVHGSGPDDVWVVGTQGTVLVWNGSGWTDRSLGEQHGLSGVWAAAPDDVWAVGDAIHHWDGTGWTTTPASDYLSAVFGLAPDDVWAVGGSMCHTTHWDGTSWTAHTCNGMWGLQDVWGASGDDVWAVGGEGDVLHWDGSSWTKEVSGTTAWMEGMWGTAADDIWAVGSPQSGSPSVLLHWDGSFWSTYSLGTNAYVSDIWGAGDQLWIVGASGMILHRQM